MKNITILVKTPATIVKQDDKILLELRGKKMIIPAICLGNTEGLDRSEGTMEYEVTFNIKYRGRDKTYYIETESEGDGISAGPFEFRFDNVQLTDLTSQPDFYAQFQNGRDLFWDSLYETLDEKLAAGELDVYLTRDGIDWEDEETLVAFKIYLAADKCVNRDLVITYASALSYDAKGVTLSEVEQSTLDSILSENLVGADQIKKRSFNSIKLKVFTFPALDSAADQEGLKNTSKNALRILQEHNAKASKPSEEN